MCPLLQKSWKNQLIGHQKHCYCQWGKFWEMCIACDSQNIIDARCILEVKLLQKQACSGLRSIKKRCQWWIAHVLSMVSQKVITKSLAMVVFRFNFYHSKWEFSYSYILTRNNCHYTETRYSLSWPCVLQLYPYPRNIRPTWFKGHAPISRLCLGLQIPCTNGPKYTYGACCLSVVFAVKRSYHCWTQP